MAELKNIVESIDNLEFKALGFRLRPMSAVDVPDRTVFLNSDGATNKLCFKDGDGVVRRFRMANL